MGYSRHGIYSFFGIKGSLSDSAKSCRGRIHNMLGIYQFIICLLAFM